MAFWDDVTSSLKNPITYVAPVLGYGKAKSDRKEQEEMARLEAGGEQRKQSLFEGLQMGREKGETLLGQSESDTSSQIQDILARRKRNLEQPSAAAEEIRRKGQTMQKQVAQRGGSSALQAQMALSGAQKAAQTEQQYKDASLANYQNLVGSILQNQMAIEPAYGKLFLASDYIAPPQDSKDIFGGLFDGLGLM